MLARQRRRAAGAGGRPAAAPDAGEGAGTRGHYQSQPCFIFLYYIFIIYMT